MPENKNIGMIKTMTALCVSCVAATSSVCILLLMLHLFEDEAGSGSHIMFGMILASSLMVVYEAAKYMYCRIVWEFMK